MREIKIGVIDEEEAYSTRLAAFLNHQGKGLWHVMAFTKESILLEYIEKRGLDIVAGTDRKVLLHAGQKRNTLSLVWLSDDSNTGMDAGEPSIKRVNRYQSALEIIKNIRGLARQKSQLYQEQLPIAAIYSPVGRCGKTSLALRIVRENIERSWLYIGLEDYNGMVLEEGQEGGGDTGELLFFLKEHLEDRIIELLRQCRGVIPTTLSFLDSMQLNQEDILWLREIVKKQGDYRGIVFDIGTGVLRDLDIFNLFDYIFVPYLEEQTAVTKKQNFEKLLSVNDLEQVRERLQPLNMEDLQTVYEKVNMTLGGNIL